MEAAIAAAQEAAASSKVVSSTDMFPWDCKQDQAKLNKVLQFGRLDKDDDKDVMELDIDSDGEEQADDGDDKIRSPLKKNGRRRATFAKAVIGK
jgi:hypothetical protein